jgi:hypothetical protein
LRTDKKNIAADEHRRSQTIAENGLGGYLFWFDNGVPMTQYFEVNPVVSNGKITFNNPIGKQPMTEGVPLPGGGPRHRATDDPGMIKNS